MKVSRLKFVKFKNKHESEIRKEHNLMCGKFAYKIQF